MQFITLISGINYVSHPDTKEQKPKVCDFKSSHGYSLFPGMILDWEYMDWNRIFTSYVKIDEFYLKITFTQLLSKKL